MATELCSRPKDHNDSLKPFAVKGAIRTKDPYSRIKREGLMINRAMILVVIGALVGGAVIMGVMRGNTSVAENELSGTGRGSVENLLANYKDWEATYVKNGGDRNRSEEHTSELQSLRQ